MKKKISIIVIIITSFIVISLGLIHITSLSPHTYYKIYVSGKYLGTIESVDDLSNYINEKNTDLKEKYGVDQIYTSNDFIAQKVITYDKNIKSNEEMYDLVSSQSTFSIKAYKFKIKNEENELVVYTLTEDIFKEAVRNTIVTFVGEDEYAAYENNTQSEITTTGSILESVYIDGDITSLYTNVSVSNNIFTSVDDLSNFLLYGEDKEQYSYTVKKGDTIESIAYDNEISEYEFLLSNPKFSNSSNLLYAGQLVSIVKLNPQINVVVDKYVISDMEKSYTVVEQYDDTKYTGETEIVQKGEDGLERVTQTIKMVNGVNYDASTISKEEIKPSVDEIVIIGEKIKSNVGSLYSWLWPTDSGYVITSTFGYRIDPIYGTRAYHSGTDIAGLGYGANIYASNNGTIELMVPASAGSGYGNYIVINHNNGYWTLYGHMQAFASGLKVGDTVTRGQIIGYIGSTGKSTGPHLHYEARKGTFSNRINAMSLY